MWQTGAGDGSFASHVRLVRFFFYTGFYLYFLCAKMNIKAGVLVNTPDPGGTYPPDFTLLILISYREEIFQKFLHVWKDIGLLHILKTQNYVLRFAIFRKVQSKVNFRTFSPFASNKLRGCYTFRRFSA